MRFRPALLPVLLIACASSTDERTELILATTTSAYESGLLDTLIDQFRALTGIDVKPIAVGSGAALMMAQRGDADATLTHDPTAEARYVAAGHLVEGRRLMHNDFVLVGPAADPAGVASNTDAVEAMRRVATLGPFVSRGDGSGTESRELLLWQEAGVPVDSVKSRVETGQGMSATLYVANDQQAYTLVDRATWLTLRNRVDLVPLLEDGARLRNDYSVHLVNPELHPGTRVVPARRFLEFMVSPAAQQVIAEFGRERLGGQLFIPDALGE
ncbi:MAG TPA: substrate-binding domain-containing protein [Gemmatimonadales bacterium]|nr:substrate-binding domain-containing protein [Gemmatimonadales bacterium]